jgi:hypothetical protein
MSINQTSESTESHIFDLASAIVAQVRERVSDQTEAAAVLSIAQIILAARPIAAQVSQSTLEQSR